MVRKFVATDAATRHSAHSFTGSHKERGSVLSHTYWLGNRGITMRGTLGFVLAAMFVVVLGTRSHSIRDAVDVSRDTTPSGVLHAVGVIPAVDLTVDAFVRSAELFAAGLTTCFTSTERCLSRTSSRTVDLARRSSVRTERDVTALVRRVIDTVNARGYTSRVKTTPQTVISSVRDMTNRIVIPFVRGFSVLTNVLSPADDSHAGEHNTRGNSTRIKHIGG